MKHIYNFIFAFIIPLSVYAQGENNEWIFGNGAHLSFNSGSAQVIYDFPEINTLEGSTSVCDSKGRLLFYSDGLEVYNRFHKRMPNGDSLMGHKSSTSSAVAVPFPGNAKKYFLFCVDQNLSARNQGVSYSIVDMNLDEGRGDIGVKNRILLSRTDEKIAVTRQCDAKSYWLVIHRAFTDSFFTYSITDKGLNPNAVVSVIKTSKTERPEIGYLKFSPSGLWLVNANTLAERLEIFKFDKRLGTLSLHAADQTQYHRAHKTDEQTYYGVAFSPYEKFLYVSILDSGEIYQYNLALSPASIFRSRVLIHRSGRPSGALQLGKDNRIYAADGYLSSCLNRINQPDKPGKLCDFDACAVYFGLDAIKVNIGLPTLIETGLNYFSLGRDLIIHHTQKMKLDAKISGGKYLWSTGETTQSIQIRDTGGVYWVNVYDPESCLYYTDTIRVMVYKNFTARPISGLSDIHICAGTVSSKIELKNADSSIDFIWFCDNTELGLPEYGRGTIPEFEMPQYTDERRFKLLVYPFKDGFIGNCDSFYISAIPAPVLDYGKVRDYVFCSGTYTDDIRIKVIKNKGPVLWHAIVNNGLPADSGGFSLPPFRCSTGLQPSKSLIRFTAWYKNCPAEPAIIGITVNPLPEKLALPDVDICYGKSAPPLTLSNRVAMCAYYWKHADSVEKLKEMLSDLPDRLQEDPGRKKQTKTIVVVAESQSCYGPPDTFLLGIKPAPIAAFTHREIEDDTAFHAIRHQFVNRSLAYDSTQWYLPWPMLDFTGDENEAEVLFPSNRRIEAGIIAVNAFACADTALKTFEINRHPRILVPTAFSPNADRNNDFLEVISSGITEYSLQIFNRWGQLVYSGNMQSKAWDGRYLGAECPDSVYSWQVRARVYDGRSIENKGSITLLR